MASEYCTHSLYGGTIFTREFGMGIQYFRDTRFTMTLVKHKCSFWWGLWLCFQVSTIKIFQWTPIICRFCRKKKSPQMTKHYTYWSASLYNKTSAAMSGTCELQFYAYNSLLSPGKLDLELVITIYVICVWAGGDDSLQANSIYVPRLKVGTSICQG